MGVHLFKKFSLYALVKHWPGSISSMEVLELWSNLAPWICSQQCFHIWDIGASLTRPGQRFFPLSICAEWRPALSPLECPDLGFTSLLKGIQLNRGRGQTGSSPSWLLVQYFPRSTIWTCAMKFTVSNTQCKASRKKHGKTRERFSWKLFFPKL